MIWTVGTSLVVNLKAEVVRTLITRGQCKDRLVGFSRSTARRSEIVPIRDFDTKKTKTEGFACTCKVYLA